MATSSYIALSTIGVKIGYAQEVARDGLANHPTVPKTGWKHIKGLKATPNFNSEADTADVSTFENTEMQSSLTLLKPAPGSLTFQAVLSQGFADDWKALVDACNTAKTANKRMYYVIYIPGFKSAQYFSGYADEINFPELSVNSAINEFDVHIDQDGGEPFVDDAPNESTGWASET